MQNEQASKPKPRDEAFDIAKGVGIVAVVGLHLTNRSAGIFHAKFGNAWWTLKWINLFLNFCVPLFLLLSAILLARGVARQYGDSTTTGPSWKVFAWRRTRSVLIPLIVWSLLYWAMRAFVQHDPRLLKPGYWNDIGSRLAELALGKAEFHLYFLSVLAQFCMVLPLLVIILRRLPRRASSIWTAVLIAVVCQAAAFAIQKIVRFDYPGSTVFWYLSTLIPGVWVGLTWSEWSKIRLQTWILWLVLTLGGFAILGYDTWLDLQKLPTNGTLTNSAAAAYALGMPFLIIGLITIWERGLVPLRIGLRRLGELSLQIYLMHPILLELLSRKFPNVFRALPFPSVWLFLITLFGTFVIALVLERLPVVNQILFGKEWRNRA